MEEARESEFLGHGVAADDMPGFEYQARVACFSQVGGGNEAIMACARYDDVELFCHLCLLSPCSLSSSAGVKG